MKRIIINNRSSLSDKAVLKRIEAVVEEGKISNHNTQYCYHTGFQDCEVQASLTKKRNTVFIVMPRN